MRTAAILPVKRFTLAKQRLGATVADPLRLDLAKAMVGDVLSVLASTGGLELTLVVTNEPWAAETASGLGVLVVPDTAEAGQSAAVGLGIERAVALGIERVLCVPGDCPALDPSEIETLLESSCADEVVVVPDRHGTGTNGLLLTPPGAIAPSFGPGSCERHRELTQAAGLPCRIARPSSLLLDIDTGADLAALRSRLSGERVHAPRTRNVLGIGGERAWRASHSAA
ncbi:MAG TPA: 2-phospho-L-lactate guanylyltransferase [Solirubrobacteraceae bacterium]|jgi:2-phospho-L-lactate guanylyltransferase